MAEKTLKTRTVVGLEIHVQLKTNTKLFCGCPVRFDAAVNSCVCPVCLGYPGAMPVLNRQAFDYALLTALALNCTIARNTRWDRKSYFYPDLPKNYQISQYDLPLGTDGYFDILVTGESRRIRIKRAHLEEDAGKNIHDASGCTLVDLNRAGTPLLEIVTEPDLSSADEVYTFCVELQRLVTYLGVSEGIMQKGQMRFEPNVNAVIEVGGGEYRTPITEIKNLNSFRAVKDAIQYESERQVNTWRQDHGYQLGKRLNENRGWNADKHVTEYQREKEAAHDYRYFPDPDLVPVAISEAMLTQYRSMLPELPIARRQRLVSEHGVSSDDAETIVSHRQTADLFEEVVAAGAPAEIASKQSVNVWLRLANARRVPIADLGVPASWMTEVAKMTADGTISKTAANRLAEVMVERSDLHATSIPTVSGACADAPEPRASARAERPEQLVSPLKLAEELGLLQTQDIAAIEAWVDQAFAANQDAVNTALNNPRKASATIGFLRGQVMKLSGGKADPNLAGQLIEKRLNDLKSAE